MHAAHHPALVKAPHLLSYVACRCSKAVSAHTALLSLHCLFVLQALADVPVDNRCKCKAHTQEAHAQAGGGK